MLVPFLGRDACKKTTPSTDSAEALRIKAAHSVVMWVLAWLT